MLGLVSLTMFPAASMAQSSQHKIKLTTSEQKKLNTFLSHFSEVFMQPFQADGLTDKELIRFGVAHNYRNRSCLFEKLNGSSTIKIRVSHVSESVRKYLGRDIAQHQSVAEYKYQNGYYHVQEASGEALQFSQAARVVGLDNHMYSVDVQVYSANSGWTGNVHGSPASWRTADDDAPQLVQKMKATIAITGGSNKGIQYTLIEYLNIQ